MTTDFLAKNLLPKNLLPRWRPHRMPSQHFNEIQGRAFQPSRPRKPDRRAVSFSAQRKTGSANPCKRRNAIRPKRGRRHSSHFAPRTCLRRSPSVASSNPLSGRGSYMSGRLSGYTGGWIRFRLKSRRRVETGTGIGDLRTAIRAMKRTGASGMSFQTTAPELPCFWALKIIEPSQV